MSAPAWAAHGYSQYEDGGGESPGAGPRALAGAS